MPVTRIPELLSVFGLAQGASACAFLAARRRRVDACNRGLLAALILLSVRLLAGAMVYGGWVPRTGLACAIGTLCAFLFWPAVVLYVRGVLARAGEGAPSVVFVPAVVASLSSFFVTRHGWFPPVSSADVSLDPLIARVAASVGPLIVLAYAVYIVAFVWKAPPHHPRTDWLRWLSLQCLLIALAIGGAFLACIGAPAFQEVFLVVDVLSEVGIASYVLMVAILHNQIFSIVPSRADSAVPRASLAEFRERLSAYMTHDRPYRNPDIRLSDLAAALGVPAHVLSGLLNREFGVSFPDFLNRYRAEEAARLLLDPERRQYTVLSIGLEVGFASKASFNRAFKRHMGVTPSEYQRRGGPPAHHFNIS